MPILVAPANLTSKERTRTLPSSPNTVRKLGQNAPVHLDSKGFVDAIRRVQELTVERKRDSDFSKAVSDAEYSARAYLEGLDANWTVAMEANSDVAWLDFRMATNAHTGYSPGFFFSSITGTIALTIDVHTQSLHAEEVERRRDALVSSLPDTLKGLGLVPRLFDGGDDPELLFEAATASSISFTRDLSTLLEDFELYLKVHTELAPVLLLNGERPKNAFEPNPWVPQKSHPVPLAGHSFEVSDRPEMTREEFALQRDFGHWVKDCGATPMQAIISSEGSESIAIPDLYVPEWKWIVEAKRSSARTYVRSAIGQVLDYAHAAKTAGRDLEPVIVLPNRPDDQLLRLLETLSIKLVVREGASFRRIAPSD